MIGIASEQRTLESQFASASLDRCFINQAARAKPVGRASGGSEPILPVQEFIVAARCGNPLTDYRVRSSTTFSWNGIDHRNRDFFARFIECHRDLFEIRRAERPSRIVAETVTLNRHSPKILIELAIVVFIMEH